MRSLFRKVILHLLYYAVPELFDYVRSETYRQNEQRAWRNRNLHNDTQLVLGMCPLANPNQVSVGHHVYGTLNIYAWGVGDEALIINNFCSIAENVRFILGGNHYTNHFSSYPFKRMVLHQEVQEATTKGKIVLEDDVWIGKDAVIMSGVILRRGTVVAAGSVVTKSTEPYTIVGGNPARLIRKRFDDKTIQQLLSVDFNKLTETFIRRNIDKLYSDNPADIQYLIDNLTTE